MRSTSGEHYIALDQVRAVAALLVFSWHFMHGFRGVPVPFGEVPVWSPLVFLDEGHVGVALFMTLSGYLFAKLLDGKKIIYRYFFWNRALRLLPLLLIVLTLKTLQVYTQTGNLQSAYLYAKALPAGFVSPTWPNGGWSVAVEMHFYLLLPILLFLKRNHVLWLWALIFIAQLARFACHSALGEVQSLAYWTLAGRIDQFVLGIIAFHSRSFFTGRHLLAVVIGAAFISLYWWFDEQGGFYYFPAYPSPSKLWIVLPTLEGLSVAGLIAWYDNSFKHKPSLVPALIAKLGEYSYSIYLFHFFFVFSLAEWIHIHLLNLSSLYVAAPVSLLAFIAMLPLGYLSMHLLEKPFLRQRRPYYVKEPPQEETRNRPNEIQAVPVTPPNSP